MIAGERLARSILTSEGKVLLKAGVALTESYIAKLKNLGVYYLYIEDERLGDIDWDNEVFTRLKGEAINNISKIYKKVSVKGSIEVNETYRTIEGLIDYILENEEVAVNLLEIKTHDNYTFMHSIDTGILASFLGRNYGLAKEHMINLAMAGILHDVGKLKISPELLNKTTDLSDEERQELMKHPLYAEEILKNCYLLPQAVITAVKQLHEREDGYGYPFGLKGKGISKLAKIISICDVYDAVSSDRSYRKKFTPSDAYELVLAGSRQIFDEEIVGVFKNTFSVYPLGTCIKLSNGTEGYVIKQNKGFPDRPVIRVLYDKHSREPIPFYDVDLLDNIDIGVLEVV